MSPTVRSRTFKIDSPHMRGDDIKDWQNEVRIGFSAMDIDCPIRPDGIYGVASRAYSASLLHALGINAGEAMKNGITPELRIKVRHLQLTHEERVRKESQELVQYRRALRKRYLSAKITNVHRPVAKIIEHSWGFHPGVHDGLDVITLPDPPIMAMVRSKIIDVRTSGWWGKAPSGDVSKGDGIVQMEILEDAGPFKKGYHIGYGHAEKPKVTVGQVVQPGQVVAHAGLAVAWHIHLMYNDGTVGTRGIGNRDPEPMLEYAIAHG